MELLPDRSDDLWYDTLVYLGVVLIAFGLGWRLDIWLENDAYAAPIFYSAILFFVYAKWVLSEHK
jgi:hypothetical protein